MLLHRKFQLQNMKNRSRRLPASPEALGIASFSLVGLCFGSAVYLAALPNLVVQSPVVSAVHETGEKTVEGAGEAFSNAVEVAKSGLSAVPLASVNAEETSTPVVNAIDEATSDQSVERQPTANAGNASADSPAQKTEDSDNVTSDPSPSPGLDEQTEAKWRNYYTVSYNNLATMVSSYNECVSDANTLKFASYQERSAAKSRCESLNSQLLKWFDYTLNSGIPDESKYFSVKDPQIICYRSLDSALSSIIKMWESNLSFSDPEGHEAEFMKPIIDDEVNGENKYITEFKQNYSSGCPSDE